MVQKEKSGMKCFFATLPMLLLLCGFGSATDEFCCGRAVQSSSIHCCSISYPLTYCDAMNDGCYSETYATWVLQGTSGPDSLYYNTISTKCPNVPDYTCTVDPTIQDRSRTKCGLSLTKPTAHMHRDDGMNHFATERAERQRRFEALWKSGEMKEKAVDATHIMKGGRHLYMAQCTGGGYLAYAQGRLFDRGIQE